MNIDLIDTVASLKTPSSQQLRRLGRSTVAVDAQELTKDNGESHWNAQLLGSSGIRKVPASTQIVKVKLAWRKQWLTKARRALLKSIVEYDNRYLVPVGGCATLRFFDGGAEVVFNTPWHTLFCCHSRLEQWAKRQGADCGWVELTEAP